jgi:hypothetical protein
MSAYGDGTPTQAALEWIELVQDDFQLTDDEMVVILLKLVHEFHDPTNDKYENLQRKPGGKIR